ncbi:MAG: NAD-dependent epimerase/dehydratase family protein [Myxococcota bacterium]|nr:NAD-dependent epimerase/dehydratase family protein [Myxococcota bacterium]
MRVLVTGGTGFVGSHLTHELLAKGHEVRLLARRPERVDAVLAPRGIVPNEVVPGDMSDAEAVERALEGCEAVIHAAASVEIAASSDTYRANVAGVEHVIEGAAKRGLDPIVHVSSIATLFPPPGPVSTPDDPIANLATDYGRSKAEGERRVRRLQDGGAPVVSVYPSGIYGPDDPGPSQTLKGLRDRLRYSWLITDGGVGIVDVRDLARVLAACLIPGRGPRRYMAGGHFLSWAAEAAICEDLVGRRVRKPRVPASAMRAMGHVVDAIRRVVPGFDYPLTHEAALFATLFRPSDDSRTLEELGVGYRPVEETLRDSIAWLVAEGHLAPKWAPALAAGAIGNQAPKRLP